jgi:hypothetical protein
MGRRRASAELMSCPLLVIHHAYGFVISGGWTWVIDLL